MSDTLKTHATVMIGLHRSRLHLRSQGATLAMSVHQASASRATVNQISLAVTAAEAREIGEAFIKAASEFEAAQN